MIDSLCQAYHWSFEEAMRRTIPQVLMLNHASWATQKRVEAKVKREGQQGEDEEEVLINGKPLEECNSDEWAAYYGGGGF